MKTRTILILSAILCVAAALAYRSSEHKQMAVAPSASVGKKLFPDFKPQAISGISFTRANGTIAVTWSNNSWIAPAKYGYPANSDKIGNFLNGLSEIRIGQVVRVSEADLPKLSLLRPDASPSTSVTGAGVSVELADDKGAKAVSFIAGKEFNSRFSGMEENPFAGDMPGGRYVKSGEYIFLIREIPANIPASVVEWLDTDLLTARIGDIDRITMTAPGRQPVVLVRIPGSGDLAPQNIATNQVPDEEKIHRISAAFCNLQFEDVADPALSDEATGMDKPVVCSAELRDKRTLTILIGKYVEQGSRRYARVKAEFNPPPEPQPDSDTPESTDTAAVSARLARIGQNEKSAADVKSWNAKHGGWTYIISDFYANPMFESEAGLVRTITPSINSVPVMED